MPAPILVAYATRYGSTAEVAEFIASTLQSRGLSARCQPAREVKSLQGIQAVVLGAPLMMVHWHTDALRFLDRFHADLQNIPTAASRWDPPPSRALKKNGPKRAPSSKKNLPAAPGSPPHPSRSLAGGGTRAKLVSPSKPSPARCPPATCATGTLSAPGRKRFSLISRPARPK